VPEPSPTSHLATTVLDYPRRRPSKFRWGCSQHSNSHWKPKLWICSAGCLANHIASSKIRLDHRRSPPSRVGMNRLNPGCQLAELDGPTEVGSVPVMRVEFRVWEASSGRSAGVASARPNAMTRRWAPRWLASDHSRGKSRGAGCGKRRGGPVTSDQGTIPLLVGQAPQIRPQDEGQGPALATRDVEAGPKLHRRRSLTRLAHRAIRQRMSTLLPGPNTFGALRLPPGGADRSSRRDEE